MTTNSTPANENNPLDDLMDYHGHDLYLHVQIKDKKKAGELFSKMFKQEEFMGVTCDQIIMGDLVSKNKKQAVEEIEGLFSEFMRNFKVITDYREEEK